MRTGAIAIPAPAQAAAPAPPGTATAARRLVHDLCGTEPDRPEVLRAGRNSLVLRVDCGGQCFVVKRYRPGPRNRQACEAAALSFLRARGCGAVPLLHAADTTSGLSVFEFVAGTPLAGPGDGDLDQAIAFALELIALSGDAGTAELPAASAAVFSLEDLAAQLAERRLGLAERARSKDLATLLQRHEGLSKEALRRAQDEAEALAWQAPLARARQILSASDFGFHNAIKRPDGTLCFFDFEYFGWDDPAKMVCDFCLHPGHDLPAGGAARFRAALLDRLAGADPTVRRRERLSRPLYALCWALIVLNDIRDADPRRADAAALVRKSQAYLARAEGLLSDSTC